MRFSLLAFIFFLSLNGFAERPKIGLALSGGGARGAAHIGVLRELERQNIPIDYIAGTSMGAIVGALYSGGYSVDEIEQIVDEIDWQAAFEDEVSRDQRSYRRKLDSRKFISNIQLGLDEKGLKLPGGIVSGQSIGLILNRYFAPISHIQKFDNLSIPFRAIATDLATGDEVVLSQGSLVEAIIASMSIPGFLIPVEIDGRILVDGGIANNLPVSVVRSMGADIVIAVDISTPLNEKEDIKDVFDVADQLSSILTRKNAELQIQSLNENDILLIPELSDITTTAFEKAKLAIPRGEQAAQASSKLKALANAIPVENHTTTLRWKDLSKQKIASILLDNDSQVPNERIRNKLNVHVGDPFSQKKLESSVDAIYGMGFFNLVQYSIEPEDSGLVITFHISEKSWGPNYLRLGFNFSASEDIDNKFNVSADYLMTNVNGYNGEVNVGVSLGNDKALNFAWYQPLDSEWSPFFELQFAYSSEQFNFFEGNNLVAEFSTQALETDLSLGFEFDNWGEVRLGTHYLDGEVIQKVGEPIFNTLHFVDAADYINFEVDTLDSLYFPRDGFMLRTAYVESNDSLGSQYNYHQNKTRVITAFEWSDNSVTVGLNYSRTKGTSIPLSAYYRTGGLLNFSGYEINQLTSQNVAHGFIAYLRKVKPVEFLDLYLGASYEEGLAWSSPERFDWDNAIEGFSVFVGADTKLGPLYLGFGKNNDDSKSFYLMLDKLF